MNIDEDSRLKQRRKRLASASTDYQRQFMKALASRKREPRNGYTSVVELVKLGESRAEAVKFFKELAATGCGRFLSGRRGQPSRIEWDVNAKEVGREFLDFVDGDENSVAEVSATPEIDELPSEAFHCHPFLLRPGVSVNIELPLDLTVEESRRLADFVRTLPFTISDPLTSQPKED